MANQQKYHVKIGITSQADLGAVDKAVKGLTDQLNKLGVTAKITGTKQEEAQTKAAAAADRAAEKTAAAAAKTASANEKAAAKTAAANEKAAESERKLKAVIAERHREQDRRVMLGGSRTNASTTALAGILKDEEKVYQQRLNAAKKFEREFNKLLVEEEKAIARQHSNAARNATLRAKARSTRTNFFQPEHSGYGRDHDPTAAFEKMFAAESTKRISQLQKDRERIAKAHDADIAARRKYQEQMKALDDKEEKQAAAHRKKMAAHEDHRAAGPKSRFAGFGVMGAIGRNLPGVDLLLAVNALKGGAWAAEAGIGKLTGAITIAGAIATAGAAAFAAFAAGITAVAAASLKFLIQGAQYNSMLEQSKLGIAAILSSSGDYVDKLGNVVDGEEKWARSMATATKMQAVLRAEALKTGASYEELNRALQEGAAPAFAAGFLPSQVVQLTSGMTQVAQAIGLPFDQLNQEIRGLIEGDMSKNSRIARLLLADFAKDAQKNGQTVREAMEEMTGTERFDLINEKMVEFRRAAAEAGNTYTVAWSNMKDAWNSAIAAGTVDGTLKLSSAIRQVTNEIVHFDEAGNAHFNQGLVAGINAATGAVAELIRKLADMGPVLVNLVGVWRSFFEATSADRARHIAAAVTRSILDKPKQMLQVLGLPTGIIDDLMPERTAVELAAQNAATNAQAAENLDKRRHQSIGKSVLGKRSLGQIRGMTEAEALRMIGQSALENSDYQEEISKAIDAVLKDASKRKDKTLTATSLRNALTAATMDAGFVPSESSAAGKKKKDIDPDQLAKSYRGLTEQFEAASAASREFTETLLQRAASSDKQSVIEGMKGELDTLKALVDQAKEGGAEETREGLEMLKVLQERVILKERDIDLSEAAVRAAGRELELAKLASDIDAQRRKAGKILADANDKANNYTPAMKADAATQYEALMAEADKGEAALMQLRLAFARETANETQTIYAKAENDRTQNSEDHIKARYKLELDNEKKLLDIFQDQIDAEKAFHKRRVEVVKRAWEDIGIAVTDSLFDAFREFGRGGKVKDIFTQLAETVSSIFSETMKAKLDLRMQEWSEAANATMVNGQLQTANGKPVTSEQQIRGARNTRWANNAMAVAGFAATGYGILQNKGATKSDNIKNGAIQGMIAGASMGIYGAIIGAIGGALLGSFGKTADRYGFNINIGSDGQIGVAAIGETKDRHAAQAVRDINTAIGAARSGLHDLFIDLPLNVLAAITGGIGNFRPPALVGPGGFQHIINAQEDGIDELREFLTITIPNKVIDAYLPALSRGFTAFGVSDEKLKKIVESIKGMDFATAQKFIKDFFTNLSLLTEVASFGSMSLTERMNYASEKLNETPLTKMKNLDARIGMLIPKDFDKMDVEQQTAYITQLRPLIAERYEMELQYLAQIKEAAEDVKKSIEEQILGYQMEDMTDQGKMDTLLGKYRDLGTRLKLAKTPEEAREIAAEMQGLIDQMVQLAGNRPEDRAHAIRLLEDLNTQTAAVFQRLGEEVQTQTNGFLAQIQVILNALQQGIEAVIPGGSNEGDSGDGDTINPERPIRTPGHALNDMSKKADEAATSIGVATSSVAQFTTALVAATGALGRVGSPSGVGSPRGEGKIVNVQPIVNVTVSGTAEKVISEITSAVISQSTAHTISVINRRQSRGSL